MFKKLVRKFGFWVVGAVSVAGMLISTGLTMTAHALQLPLPNATDFANGGALLSSGATNFPVVTAVMATALLVILIVFIWSRIIRGAPRR